MTINEVLGGERDLLGSMGPYQGPINDSEAPLSWDADVAARRAANSIYEAPPLRVVITGKRKTPDEQLASLFGLNKKVVFAQAMAPSRIEAVPSIWSTYGNIAGAYSDNKIGLSDAVAMAWDNTKFAYRGSQRTQGAVQAVNGAFEIGGALAISGTGVGTVVGLPLAAHGGDNIGTGLRRVWTGEDLRTLTYRGVSASTGSNRVAAFVDTAIPFVGGVAAAATVLPSSAAVIRETGARQIINPDSLRAWDLAEDAYESIRASTTDVGAIAKNTGWSETRIDRIKDHLFVNEHQLSSSFSRFDADPAVVNAWNRLTLGDHLPSDISLLRHEIFESKFEGIFKTNYGTAHDAALRAGRTWIPE